MELLGPKLSGGQQPLLRAEVTPQMAKNHGQGLKDAPRSRQGEAERSLLGLLV